MNALCDYDQVAVIAHGHYTDACRTIGQANLATILAAEQELAQAKAWAEVQRKPCAAYIGLLKLAKGRRRRLQQEDIQRQQQGKQPATIRL